MPARASIVDLNVLFPFYTPDVPDLGCFVEHRHDLESYDFYVWGEPSPWNLAGIITHQTYARVICGEAGAYQRAQVVMLDGFSSMFDALASTPDFVLGGDFRAQPSEWIKFPTQSANKMYWFVGAHRDPSSASWQPDAVVGHSFDIYENGTLSTVHFDDTRADGEMDDFILEVAVVHRRRFVDVFEPLVFGEAELRRFEAQEFPRVREAIRGTREVKDQSASARSRRGTA